MLQRVKGGMGSFCEDLGEGLLDLNTGLVGLR